MNRWTLLAASTVVLSVGGCVDRAAQKESKATEQLVTNPVKAVTVKESHAETLTQTVEMTGDVTALDDTTIGSKQNNRVTGVFVNDGDSVTKGELLATLDDTGANAQLKQAQAQVATAISSMMNARAQLAQAEQNFAVGPHRSTVGVLMAQAEVNGSRRGYDKVVNGARPEERKQAEANLESAKANLVYQQKQYERMKTLVDEGAMAGQNLDQQKAAFDQAVAQVKNAQEAVDIDINGSRPEDIDSAKAQLEQALQSLKSAEDQKKLDPLLRDQVDAAKAQVDGARAQLESAHAQIQIAEQAVADTKIYAPFDGHVAGRPIQPGSVAGQSTAIVRIVGNNGIYFSGQLPSSSIDAIQSGQAVAVHVNGLPGKTFTAQVATMDPIADSVGRLFSLRVLFTGSVNGLKPGMFAHGAVTVRTLPDVVVVPGVAVQTGGSGQFVYVVKDGKAHKVAVTTGLTKGDDVQVTGLSVGAKVVVEGQEALVEGAKVNAKLQATAVRQGSNSDEAEG